MNKKFVVGAAVETRGGIPCVLHRVSDASFDLRYKNSPHINIPRLNELPIKELVNLGEKLIWNSENR